MTLGSIQAARRRLEHGCCPLHGLELRPIKDVEQDSLGNLYVEVKCVCDVSGWFYTASGSYELSHRFRHLIAAGHA